MPGTARILAIDGGGIRGIIPGMILDRIEQRTGQGIADLFHMITGTSTGGFLALGLTRPNEEGSGPELSAGKLVDLYRNDGERIFRRSFWKGFSSLAGISDEKYDARNLEEVLEQYLGDALVSDALGDVFVTAYDLESRVPVFMKSWRARGEHLKEGETAEDRDFFMRDAARATSAAPTYFEPASIKNRAGN